MSAPIHSNINYNDAVITILTHPMGTNLSNPSTRSAPPTMAQTAYDRTTNGLYLGDNTTNWRPFSVGDITNITLAPIGNTANANGATLTGATLNLQPANISFGGVVTTGSQQFTGQKNFSSGITLGLYSSNLNDYSLVTVSLNFAGAVTSTNQNVTFERIGSTVHVTFPKVYSNKSILSNPASIDVTGAIPPQFIPTTDKYAAINVYSAISTNVSTNNEYVPGVIKITGTTGVMNIGVSIQTTDNTIILFGDTGSGTYNGVTNQTITYSLV